MEERVRKHRVDEHEISDGDMSQDMGRYTKIAQGRRTTIVGALHVAHLYSLITLCFLLLQIYRFVLALSRTLLLVVAIVVVVVCIVTTTSLT